MGDDVQQTLAKQQKRAHMRDTTGSHPKKSQIAWHCLPPVLGKENETESDTATEIETDRQTETET